MNNIKCVEMNVDSSESSAEPASAEKPANMSIFANPKMRPVLGIFVAFGWSLAYPLIKLGFAEFGVNSEDMGGQLLFAGMRFMAAGLVVIILASLSHKDMKIRNAETVGWLALYGFVGTTLQYLFTYIGLSHLQSSRSSILNAMATFLVIIMSSIIFRDDRMTRRKVIGCIVGFAGIVLVAINPGEKIFAGISFIGDGMILLNDVAAASRGLMTRFVNRRINIITATGYSMAFGGVVLAVAGRTVGTGSPWTVTPRGILILLCLVMISALCFSIYNSMITYHPISSVAIYCALIPVLGVILSSLILHEPFRLQYMIAGIVVSLGVYIVNTVSAKK